MFPLQCLHGGCGEIFTRAWRVAWLLTLVNESNLTQTVENVSFCNEPTFAATLFLFVKVRYVDVDAQVNVHRDVHVK